LLAATISAAASGFDSHQLYDAAGLWIPPMATPAEAALFFVASVAGAEVLMGVVEGAGILLLKVGGEVIAYRVGNFRSAHF